MGEQKKRKKKKIKIRHDGTTGGKGPSHRRDLRPQTKSSAHWLGHAEASVYTSRPKSHPQMRGIFTSWTKGESARDSFLIKAVNFCILALVCCDVPLPALEPKQKDPSTRRSASDCPLGHHQSDGAFSSSSGIKGLWFRRSNIMIADSHTITLSQKSSGDFTPSPLRSKKTRRQKQRWLALSGQESPSPDQQWKQLYHSAPSRSGPSLSRSRPASLPLCAPGSGKKNEGGSGLTLKVHPWFSYCSRLFSCPLVRR